MGVWLLSFILATMPTKSPTVVAIDAGHGGEHLGAEGVCGVLEKDITLQLAWQLSALLKATHLVQPVLIRQDDTTLDLQARAQKANEAQATMFVSIHTNASTNTHAHGIETFFLSQHAANDRLAHLAHRENEGMYFDQAVAQSVDVNFILNSLSLNAAHTESQQLALRVQQTLSKRLKSRGRGVLQAPFMVLLHARMAAILVEVGFLTNPQECLQLANSAYQQSVVQALAEAILLHVSSQ